MNTLVCRAPWRGLLGASRSPKYLNGRRKGYWQAVARSRRQLEIIGVIKTAPNNEQPGEGLDSQQRWRHLSRKIFANGPLSKTFRKGVNPIRAKRQRQNAADG
jgi:hypothetical protein